MNNITITALLPNEDNLYQKQYYKEMLEITIKIEHVFKSISKRMPVFIMLNHTYSTINDFIISNEWGHIVALEAEDYGFIIKVNNNNFLKISIDG